MLVLLLDLAENSSSPVTFDETRLTGDETDDTRRRNPKGIDAPSRSRRRTDEFLVVVGASAHKFGKVRG